VTAVITAEGENVNTAFAKEAGNAPATTTGNQPKAAHKARVAKPGAARCAQEGSVASFGTEQEFSGKTRSPEPYAATSKSSAMAEP
jgi:hypothetical protein